MAVAASWKLPYLAGYRVVAHPTTVKFGLPTAEEESRRFACHRGTAGAEAVMFDG